MVLVAAAVSAGCGGSGASSPSSTATPSTSPTTTTTLPPALVATTGGTVTMAVPQVPVSLNPHSPAGDTVETRMVASVTLPQVWTMGAGLVPTADWSFITRAEVVSVNPQTVEYDIAPAAVWSDGQPITASDFVYAWQAQRGNGVDLTRQPDQVVSTLGYSDIASVVGSNGGRTVVVTFLRPYGDWQSLFNDLLPAHVASEIGWNTGYDAPNANAFVSGGPFEVSIWQPGVRLVLQRNPAWWGPAPKLDQIVMEAVPGEAEQAALLATRQVQVAFGAPTNPAGLAAMSSLPWANGEVDLSDTLEQLDFNTDQPLLSEAPVRVALADLVDRGAVANLATGVDGAIGPADDRFAVVGSAAYAADGSAFDQPDPVTAARLLRRAGLHRDRSGRWMRDGSQVTLRIAWADDDGWSAAIGPVIASQLAGRGFDVDEIPVPGAQLTGDVLASGQWDLAIVPEDVSPYPSQMVGDYSLSVDSGEELDAHDWSGFDDRTLDALLTDAVENLNGTGAQAAYQRIDTLLWQLMPTLPLFFVPIAVYHDVRVTNVADPRGGPELLWQAPSWALLEPEPASP